MAIVICPDCNANVSDRASTCPQCGYPINEYVREREQKKNEYENNLRQQNKNCSELCNEISRLLEDDGNYANIVSEVGICMELIREKEPEHPYVKMYDGVMGFENMSSYERMNTLSGNIYYYSKLQTKKVVEKFSNVTLVGGIMTEIHVAGGITFGTAFNISKEFAEERMKIPVYLCLRKDFREINTAIYDESYMVGDNVNCVRLCSSKFTNTENFIRVSIQSLFEMYKQLVEGSSSWRTNKLDIEKAWGLPVERNNDNEKSITKFELGNLEYKGKTTVSRMGLSQTKIHNKFSDIMHNACNEVIYSSSNARTNRRPMGVGAGTFVGALVAGPVGAMVGYAVSSE